MSGAEAGLLLGLAPLFLFVVGFVAYEMGKRS